MASLLCDDGVTADDVFEQPDLDASDNEVPEIDESTLDMALQTAGSAFDPEYYTEQQVASASALEVLQAKVITAIRQYPAIYDKKRFVNRKCVLREQCFVKAAEEVGISGNFQRF